MLKKAEEGRGTSLPASKDGGYHQIPRYLFKGLSQFAFNDMYCDPAMVTSSDCIRNFYLSHVHVLSTDVAVIYERTFEQNNLQWKQERQVSSVKSTFMNE